MHTKYLLSVGSSRYDIIRERLVRRNSTRRNNLPQLCQARVDKLSHANERRRRIPVPFNQEYERMLYERRQTDTACSTWLHRPYARWWV
jgi:hypothetical protein